MHLAEKILLLQPLTFGGDYHSTAIMTWLADSHGKFTNPPGTIARARQDAFTHQILDEMDGVLWTAARHSFVLPEEHRVPAIKDSLRWEYERNVARLSDVFRGPFLQGADMTIADILLTHCLGWAARANFPDAEENLKAYMAKMTARPAFQRAAALP